MDLTLTVGGLAISGWTTIRLTRGIERCPSDFEVTATSDSPLYADAVGIVAGSPCTVSLGPDLVLTGYVDVVQPRYNAQMHEVMIAGRGKCADLVDCSAEVPTGQIGNADLLSIATKVCAPYGITASALVDTGDTIPQFNINIGETPWSILERIARQSSLLLYEGTDGNLIFAQGGSDVSASGFVEGQNVQAAAVTRSVAERYQTYLCSMISMVILTDAGPSDPFFFAVNDPNVIRNRRLYLVAEDIQGGIDLVKKRATWEMNRRYGRGNTVTLTADSWTDTDGDLWEPNNLAYVTLPRLGMPETELLIGEVTYRRGAEGTTAEITLAPQAAFLPEPIQLQPSLQGAINPDTSK